MPHLVAFDIDGVLTEKKGRKLYREKRSEGHTVGVITARPMESAQEFIDKYNLNPAFIRSSPFKGKVMRDLSNKYDREEYVYYGSWMKDQFQTMIAGWDYRAGS